MASRGGRVPESYEPGQYVYHYNREAREEMLPDETKRVLTKSRLFTLNRRNLIILIDIVVILLFAMIFIPISMGLKRNVRIDGFRATLRAYEYDGSVLMSVRVTAPESNPDESGIITAEFSAEGIDQVIEAADLLPSEPDKDRILRAEFDSEKVEGSRAEAHIEINGKKRKLSTAIKDE